MNKSQSLYHTAQTLPKQYKPKDVERKWQTQWESTKIYHWDKTCSREKTFVVDTPPPTASGSLHIGHVFSYTHTDIVVRYKRMQGLNIMYPIGWDDNGLPTERRVQNKHNITCNPKLPYISDLKIERAKSSKQKSIEVSRPNFVEICNQVTREDEVVFANLWRQLGLSVDWRQEYNTIGDRSRHISQLSFIDLKEKGLAYQTESPTIWDVTFKSAVAQAELEDREIPGLFHDIKFPVRGGGSFVISTTRPELIPACIAIVAHPDDSRHNALFGKKAITPVFGTPIPILPSEHVDPDKGTGIMMVCTFGDTADVAWWKSSGLPLRMIVGHDGRLLPVTFGSDLFPSGNASRANAAYKRIEGCTIWGARKEMARILAEPDTLGEGYVPALQSEPRKIKHTVKFYEKGDAPVEFVSSRQWYINIVDQKDDFLDLGSKIKWHPAHMKLRYDHWVKGLNHDWCISRQRFFGVPFPVWYPVDSSGNTEFSKPILASRDRLPIDPQVDVPPGYTAEDRGIPNGFVGDSDVMDTWATSSLTPQIVAKWGLAGDLSSKLLPMDIHPQGPEIIRTWAFYTIVKSWAHNGEVPWKNITISGWILDPDRKKMSKSKGNVVTPASLLDNYSSDAVRYWAARARLGVDTALDEKVFKSGRKVSVKVFNASKFVIGQLTKLEEDLNILSLADVTQAVDFSWLRQMGNMIDSATKAFDQFEHTRALSVIESTFWNFCDNYLEIVKERGYKGVYTERRSALAALKWSLDTFLHVFAPFMPFVTEEVWSYCPWKPEVSRSIHTDPWPKGEELLSISCPSSSHAFDFAVQVISEIRRAKSAAGRGFKWPVTNLEIMASADEITLFENISDDIKRAGALLPNAVSIKQASTEETTSIIVRLAEDDA